MKPKRSAARLEPAFSSLHFHSRRRLPRSSNACLAMTKIASVAWRLFWSRGESQMWPISMTPCSGTMLMKVAIPVAARAERSMIANASGSAMAARSSNQRMNSSLPAKGP